MGKIVAYMERDSVDPMTCEKGKLRDEWRIRMISDFSRIELEDAFGRDWRRYSPGAQCILEHRYIRRGVIEPWKPFQSANSFNQALSYIDDKAISMCATLTTMQQDRKAYREAQEIKHEQELEEKRIAEEKKDRCLQSEAAFRRMASSKKFGHYAKQWNEFAQKNVDNTKLKIAIKETNYLLEAYNAVIDATTIPVKAMAIKKFFKLLSFQYRALIPKIKKD